MAARDWKTIATVKKVGVTPLRGRVSVNVTLILAITIIIDQMTSDVG